jgi:hypothetical protein
MAPRLLAFVCLLIAGGGSHAAAQTSGDPSTFFEWSADRPLAIKDFKGKIPARATESSRSWVAIEASWECADGKGSWQVRAVFDPNRSFWRPITQDLWKGSDDLSLMAPHDDDGRGLLSHEQLHFDLTELWARKIRGALKALPAACKTPAGARGFDNSIAQMERAWQEEQQRYDKETSHGTDPGRQKAWAKKAAAALKEEL